MPKRIREAAAEAVDKAFEGLDLDHINSWGSSSESKYKAREYAIGAVTEMWSTYQVEQAIDGEVAVMTVKYLFDQGVLNGMTRGW